MPPLLYWSMFWDASECPLTGLIGEARLVNPLRCFVLCIGVIISWSSIEHGGDLVLDAQLETLSKFHY